MNSTAVKLIERILNGLNKHETNNINMLGEVAKNITKDVIKYNAHDKNITHFIVFQREGSIYKITFYCESLSFSLKEIEKVFGVYENNYNFRENYSEFKFRLNSNIISELFFIKDNRFEIKDAGNILEITPKGNETKYEDLKFNGFCFRWK